MLQDFLNKFKFASNVVISIFLIIGIWCFYTIYTTMAPEMKSNKIRNDNIQKIHTSEFSQVINGNTILTNYDGIKITVNRKNNMVLLTVDTNSLTIPRNKISSAITNNERPLATISCEGLLNSDYNSDIKDQFMQEKISGIQKYMFNFYHGKPDGSKGYRACIFPLTEKSYNLYINKIDQFGIAMLDPNIKLIRVTIMYDYSLSNSNLTSVQTYNYIVLQ